MSKFIEALTHELRGFQDETLWLSYDVVQDMLIRAAAEVVVDEPEQVRLYRQIDPEDLQPVTILEVEGDSVVLFSEHVATLRALLLCFDEGAPAKVGEPLTTPVKLADSRVVSQVVEELLPTD